jgi:uncharacterized membrane protein YGL010W
MDLAARGFAAQDVGGQSMNAEMFTRSEQMTNWLHFYAKDHRDPVNHRIHQFCIPVIVFSAMGLLNLLPWRVVFWGVHFGPAEGALALLLAFYAPHDLKLAMIAAPIGALMAVMARHVPWWGHVSLFILSWIAQLIGHARWEKNKPSLTANLVALLVAPVFLLDEWIFAKR